MLSLDDSNDDDDSDVDSDDSDDDDLILTRVTTEYSNDWFIRWMRHHFTKRCYNSSIITKCTNEYLVEHDTKSPLNIAIMHIMTTLHMLSMNPHSPVDAITALLYVILEAAFRLDNEGKIPLDYAKDYDVGALVEIIIGLCNHRGSSICSSGLCLR